jgi:flagellar hook assembly protein FlgD
MTQSNTHSPTKTITFTHTVIPTPNINIALDKNYIKPLQGEQVKISIKSDEIGKEVEFKVYNLTGEVIRKWNGQIYMSGWNEYYWDGKNNSGKFAGQGIYFIHILIKDTGNEVRRIYVIK